MDTYLAAGLTWTYHGSQRVTCNHIPSTSVNLYGHSPCVECEHAPRIGTYLWSHVSSKPARPIVITDVSLRLHQPVTWAPTHHPLHTIRVSTRGGRTSACRGINQGPETYAIIELKLF